MKSTKYLILRLIFCLSLSVMLLAGCSPSNKNEKEDNGDSNQTITNSTNKDFEITQGVVWLYKASSADVVIPESDEGYTVTELSDELFRDMRIKTVTIPKTVTKIDLYAFTGCEALEAVYFEGSLADWCAITFVNDGSNPLGCKSAPKLYCEGALISGEVTIPHGIEEVSKYAFYNYGAITAITIPEGVRNIGAHAFATTAFNSVSLPSTLEKIDEGAFKCSSITSLSLPDSVKTIGKEAFWRADELRSVDFGEGVESIGNSAFAGCNVLGSFTLPESVREIGDGAFADCDAMISFTLPSSITAVPLALLSNCDSLTEINLHEGVCEIGEAAFSNCKSLRNITLPSSVTVIPERAFSGCRSLESIPLTESITEIGAQAFRECGLTSAVIPESVTKLGAGAFYSCHSLAEVNLHDALEVGDEYSIFENCESIKSAAIPAPLFYTLADSIASLESLTVVGNGKGASYSFADFTSLSSLTLSESVVTISVSLLPKTLKKIYYTGTLADFARMTVSGDLSAIVDELYINGANAYLDGDLSLVIDDDREKIEDYNFAGFKCLASVTLPASVRVIGTNAFKDCENIKTLNYLGTLDDWFGVDSGYYSPMYYGAQLKINGESLPESIVVSADVARINNYAFVNQSAIKKITFESCDTAIGMSAFAGCNNVIYAKGDYRLFTSLLPMEEYPALASAVVMGNVAVNFSGCPNLESISYENTCFGIGRNQFEGTKFYEDLANWQDGCLYLQDVLLAVDPDSVTEGAYTVKDGTVHIGTSAFSDVDINEITLPDGLLTIGASAFEGVPIVKLALPDTVNKLGNRALAYMTELISLRLGAGLTECDGAFTGTEVIELINKSDTPAYSLGIEYTYAVSKAGTFSTTEEGLFTYSYTGDRIIRHIISYSGSERVLDLTGYNAISDFAFADNAELEEVTVGCAIIPYYAFRNCTGLRKITLLAQVGYIESFAFLGCGELDSVTIVNFHSITYTKKSEVAGLPGFYKEEEKVYSPFDPVDSDEKMVEIFNHETARNHEMWINHRN